MPLKIVLSLVAISQLVLGGLTLFVPLQFATWIGLATPPAGTGYLIGMLGVRFVCYGIGLIWLARQPVPDRFWVNNMALIQLLDFADGGYYLLTGAIGPATAVFPMFNAALFGGLLWWFNRRGSTLAPA